MAKITAIFNARPLTSRSTYAANANILIPATLLIQKALLFYVPPALVDDANVFQRHLREVPSQANTSWGYWKQQYVNNLQGFH